MTAASAELIGYLVDMVERAIGPIRTRKMFAGVGIWQDELFFAMIHDDVLAIRLDESDEAEYIRLGFVPNDPSSAGKGRKRYYEVPADIIEDEEVLGDWLAKSLRTASTDG